MLIFTQQVINGRSAPYRSDPPRKCSKKAISIITFIISTTCCSLVFALCALPNYENAIAIHTLIFVTIIVLFAYTCMNGSRSLLIGVCVFSILVSLTLTGLFITEILEWVELRKDIADCVYQCNLPKAKIMILLLVIITEFVMALILFLGSMIVLVRTCKPPEVIKVNNS